MRAVPIGAALAAADLAGVMSVYSHPVPRVLPQAVRQLGWFALVCAVAFLVSYLGVSVLGLHHDLFYLVYFAIDQG